MNAGSALLATSGLSKSFGGVRAVDDVAMTIREGERVCIIGPNGAGKSTLISLISGTQQPSAGTIELAGVSLVGRPTHEFCRRGIVRKFQGSNAFQWLTVRDNLAVAGLSASAEAMSDPVDAEEVLDLVRLRPQAELTAETLSHGQRQWLEVGMTLMCRPRVLLLDEPTAGMTVEGTKDMVRLIERLDGRFAIVVIEHDLAFVRSMNCRTLVMHQGAIIRDGAFADIERDDEVRDVYLGKGLARALG